MAKDRNPRLLTLLFICVSFISDTSGQPLNRYTFTSPQMGTTFKIILYAGDDSVANVASKAAFKKVEALNQILSDYEKDSELNNLSRLSGRDEWIPVSSPLFSVLSKAQEVAQKTDGAFDITIGPYVQRWRMMGKESNPTLPSGDTLSKLSKSVGFKYVKLDSSAKAVKLLQQNMQLDAGGIAKGFAADEALDMLKHYGITSALVDAGGDIVLGDAPPGKKGWEISLLYHSNGGKTCTMTVSLANKAVATSGDLFQHIKIGNKRYSHIINPQTGLGLKNQRLVTVIAPDGITADSYASAVCVLGPQKGIELIEEESQFSGFIELREKGKIERCYSSTFKNLKK